MAKKKVNENGFQIEEKGKFVIDMVCGMELKPDEAKYSLEFYGELYFFCSDNCKQHFEDNPEIYAKV